MVVSPSLLRELRLASLQLRMAARSWMGVVALQRTLVNQRRKDMCGAIGSAILGGIECAWIVQLDVCSGLVGESTPDGVASQD